jgi:hypothetical protein
VEKAVGAGTAAGPVAFSDPTCWRAACSSLTIAYTIALN